MNIEHPIKKEEGKRGPIKVDTVISAMKNEKVSIKVWNYHCLTHLKCSIYTDGVQINVLTMFLFSILRIDCILKYFRYPCHTPAMHQWHYDTFIEKVISDNNLNMSYKLYWCLPWNVLTLSQEDVQFITAVFLTHPLLHLPLPSSPSSHFLLHKRHWRRGNWQGRWSSSSI